MGRKERKQKVLLLGGTLAKWFRTAGLKYKSQVTGHRSQDTGHRLQVAGHNKKYLWICGEFVFGLYSLFIPTNPTMSYFSKIPTSLRFQSVKSAFIKSFFSFFFWSLIRVKRTDNILRKIVTFDAP